jgi:membrane-associated protein
MTVILDKVLLFVDSESVIRYGGLLLVCLIIYVNTGLFFCFFLPSGAVLFTAGVFSGTGTLPQNAFTVCCVLVIASVLGTLTGYAFGRRAGRVLYRRNDSRFFRRQYLVATESFYKKYGALACLVSYFLPIIRTFAPVVAGMIKLNLRRFVLLTFAGSVIWITGFVLAGYYIGSRPLLKPWLKYIVIGFILLVTIPLVIRITGRIRRLRREIDRTGKGNSNTGF